MLKSLLVSLILILGFPACFSQLPEDFPLVNKADLPEAKFSSSRTFNGTALFGYIDGGAELYLEYGFYQVQNQSGPAREKLVQLYVNFPASATAGRMELHPEISPDQELIRAGKLLEAGKAALA